MNDTYLHITLTHFPIVGSLITLILLISGYIQKNGSITKAGLYLLIVMSLLTFVANHTGEEAEEFVEHLAGYSHDAIHEHEEIAEWAFRVMLAVGAGAIAAIYLLRKRSAKARLAVLLVLIGNLAGCILMVYAGKKGGEIRHTEVYETTTQTPTVAE